MFESVVDRNPTSAKRYSDLIERWLLNIDRLFEQQPGHASHWRGRRRGGAGDLQDLEAGTDNKKDFSIGEFLGQGRRLRYCGVTDTVLARIANPEEQDLDLPDLLGDAQAHARFQRDLVARPLVWYMTWLTTQFIVSTGFTMAAMVSFNTPTVGLGCRSVSYLAWWCCTRPSWVLLGLQQEPRPWARRVMVVAPNALAVAGLFAVMLVQTLGGFNDCVCKSSVFGRGTDIRGGYMDFENGEFYRRHYDVSAFWGAATGIGGSTLVFSIAWLAWKWHKSSSLWKVTENNSLLLRDDVPLDWPT